MATIGANIAKLRRQKEMTQEELASIIGVSAQSVSKWENSTTMPDITLLPILADTFGVTIDSLFGKSTPGLQGGSPDHAFERSCEAIKKVIVSAVADPSCNPKEFDALLQEHSASLASDSHMRSIIIRNHGVVYYREEVGGLLLKKPEGGWASLLEGDGAAKITALLSNRDFCKVLAVILKMNMSSFTLPSLCNFCKVEATDELRDVLLSSGFFRIKSVNIDGQDVEIYELYESHRLFLLFAVLGYAKEFADYKDTYYYFYGNGDFFRE